MYGAKSPLKIRTSLRWIEKTGFLLDVCFWNNLEFQIYAILIGQRVRLTAHAASGNGRLSEPLQHVDQIGHA